MPVVLLLLTGVLAYSFINQGKAAVSFWQFEPKRLVKFNPSIFSSTVDFTFKIVNSTNSSATITGIDGVLLAGGAQFGTFLINKPFTIPSGGEVEVAARVSLNNLTTLKQLVNIALKGSTPEIIFKGGISTQLLGRIPFEYTALLQQDFNFKKKETKVAGIGSAYIDPIIEVNAVAKQIEKLTAANDHNKARTFLAHWLLDKQRWEKLKNIEAAHNSRGHILSNEIAEREKITKQLINKVAKKYGELAANKIKAAL